MIYILEVPHQRPPVAWVADDEQHALDILNAVGDDLGAELASDNYYHIIANSVADLAEKFERRAVPHQFFAALCETEGLAQ